MKNIFLLVSVLALAQCARAVEYTTYSWVNLSGTAMTGEWDIDSASYNAGYKASLDTHLSLSFADTFMSDYLNPYFTLSQDRSSLFVSGTWNDLVTLNYITFQTDQTGIISWTGGPRFGGPTETYSGSGFFRNLLVGAEGVPVPDSGSSLALLFVGLGVLAGVGKVNSLARRRT